ncbi:MAG: Ig-like domain-containing protein [Pseudomonadota bacterium]
MRMSIIVLVGVLSGCGGGGGGSTPSTPTPPPTNRAPSASDASALIQPGETLSGTLSATDPDNDSLTYSVSQQPANGTVTLTGMDYEYQPSPGFSGTDSFQFVANDGQVDSNAGTVSIRVNGRPMVAPTSVETSDFGMLRVEPVITDPEGDNLIVSITGQPTRGTITELDVATGAFTYTPDPDEDGLDSVELVAADPFQDSGAESISIEIFNWMGNGTSGTDGDDFVSTLSLIETAGGGLLFGGGSNGSFTGAPAPANTRAVLRELDRRGAIVATNELGDGATFSSVRSILAIDGSSDYFVLESGSGDLIRMNEAGAELWRRSPDFGTFVSQANFRTGYGAAIDTNNDVVVLHRGITDPMRSDIGMVLVKYSGSDGQILWQRDLRPSSAGAPTPWIENSRLVDAFGLTVDDANDVYLTGDFFADDDVAAGCTACNFIAKLDSQGNDIWLRDGIPFDDFCDNGDVFLSEASQFLRVTVATTGELYIVGADLRVRDTGDVFQTAFVRQFTSDGTSSNWTYCDSAARLSNTFSFVPVQETTGGDFLFSTSREAIVSTGSGDVPSLFVGFVQLGNQGNIVNDSDIRLQAPTGEEYRLRSATFVQASDGFYYFAVNADGVVGAPADDDFAVIRVDDAGFVQP